MRCPRCPSIDHYWHGLLLVIVLLASACGRSPAPPAAPAAIGEVRTFTGTWSATGNRQMMQLGPGHEAGIFKVSGSLLLTGTQRLTAGFKADVIGFSDTLGGMQGRSVWTDERGDKVFSELRGEEAGPGKLIKGRFLGGSGRYAGVSGEYTFRWQRLGVNEDGELSGRVVGLEGWARLAPSAAIPTATGGRR